MIVYKSFEEGHDYIIREIIFLSSDLYLPQNVTLIFEGGMMMSDVPVTIFGNNTKIVAPIETVFGENVSVKGSWSMDRSYPQWFEPDVLNGSTDYAGAINKAIVMKRQGEVFLPGGDYYISSPIFIPHGIHLIGEQGQLYDRKTTTIYPLGSKLVDGKMLYAYKHMVLINTDENYNAIEPYANQWVGVSNIIFSNLISCFPNGRCMYISSGVSINQVYWYEFLQAAEFKYIYSDTKSITNCTFSNENDIVIPDNLTDDELRDYSAFNLNGLGDALRFEHNSLGTKGQPYALYLCECGGGRISNNILCGDVLIRYSKAVTISNNHMEGGPQIRIEYSSVIIEENYIEKGIKPSVCIIGLNVGFAVVSLRGNQYIYYDLNRNQDEHNGRLDLKKKRLDAISEFDIEINEFVLVNIQNEYRYYLCSGFGDMVLHGISVKSTNDTFTNKFLQQSYYLSQSSEVTRGYGIRASADFMSINAPFIYHMQYFNNINWFGKSGVYMYEYQIAWDYDRAIFKSESGHAWFKIISDQNPIEVVENQSGILFALSSSSGLLIHLKRHRLNPGNYEEILESEEVFVPVCGASHIYDNGLSICGFKWRQVNLDLKDTDAVIHFDRYENINGRVNAWAICEDMPVLNSHWSVGDIIYNISPTDENWSIKIVK